MLGSNCLGLVGLDPTVTLLAVHQRSGGSPFRKSKKSAGPSRAQVCRSQARRPASSVCVELNNGTRMRPMHVRNGSGDTGRYSRSFGLSASLHRRLLESEKPTVSPQRSPETLQTRRPTISLVRLL